MPVSGEQLVRAAKDLSRGNARLRAELLSNFKEFSQFLVALQSALELVEIHDGFSKAGRAAWKVLSALRVEGD